MPEFVTLDPQRMSSAEAYDVLVASVQPRPIAFVSTLDGEGRPNLAPFSFFMPGGSSPPSLVVSVTLGAAGRRKDTLRNVEATHEFVVNIVVRSMAEGMNATSFSFPPGDSEWEPGGFTAVPSELVAPPRVEESPVQFECKLFQVVQHGESSGSACYIIGEVVRMHVNSELWSESGIDPATLRPISRLGGPHYLDTDALERFTMERP